MEINWTTIVDANIDDSHAHKVFGFRGEIANGERLTGADADSLIREFNSAVGASRLMTKNAGELYQLKGQSDGM